MAELKWDQVGEKTYEHGVSRGVLYPTDKQGAYTKGVAWNGLTSVSESPEGGDANDIYADNIKYISLMAAETFKATIEAYTYPDEFAECDGSAEPVPGVKAGQQPRKAFGFSYSTVKGNDTVGDAYSELIHILYGCKAAPSERSYQTISDSPEPISFSWELSCDPVPVEGLKPTAILVIDTKKIGDKATKALKETLYGTSNKDAKLPTPDEVIKLIKDNPASGSPGVVPGG